MNVFQINILNILSKTDYLNSFSILKKVEVGNAARGEIYNNKKVNLLICRHI